MKSKYEDDAVSSLFACFGGDQEEHSLSKSQHLTKKRGLSAPIIEAVEETASVVKEKKKRKSGLEGEVDEANVVEEKSLFSSLFEDASENSINVNNSPEEVIIETYRSEYQNCVHECVRPANREGTSSIILDEEINFKPARKFPYTLDPFQKTAIKCLEAKESVLVSAHTSSGKTTVAEYAVAMGLRDEQRVIYTSPIKALSNQKYRDLSEYYGDSVGLLTGDVSLNPSASVLIMTTEILRSMLYRGSTIIREMKWVIFDEIHYMRDRERGVVWEETIILLPDFARLVFLSATIPNAREFAEWICRIKHQPCHVIYTDSRPVPLQHYLFPVGSDSVHLVLDENKNFKEHDFYRAVGELNCKLQNLQIETKARLAKNSSKNDIEKLVMMCHQRNYTPVIIFAFSKREVESNALNLKKVRLTTEEEAELIEQIFNNAIDTLNEEDRQIPQIIHMLPLLKRGIGLHHGGLLPIIREIVEILFQESLVKVLFSTETFSMGVNMPAKTVVFTKLKKWDGTTYRLLSAGEYIQMSGRAGRRGIDERGLSILMFDEQMTTETAKQFFLGDALRIESQFHLSYNMVLNLLRVEGADPEYMVQRSFYQFQQDKATLKLEEQRLKIIEQLKQMNTIIEPGETLDKLRTETFTQSLSESEIEQALSSYYTTKREIILLEEQKRNIITLPRHILKYMQPGRVVSVLFDSDNNDFPKTSWGYGIVVDTPYKQRSLTKRNSTNEEPADSAQSKHAFVVNVLLRCQSASTTATEDRWTQTASLRPCSVNDTTLGIWDIVPCRLSSIEKLTQVVANLPSTSPRGSAAALPARFSFETDSATKEALGKILNLILDQFKGNLPLVDPVDNMKIEDAEVEDCCKKLKTLEAELEANPLKSSSVLPQLYNKFHERVSLLVEKQKLEQSLETKKILVMRDELRGMRRVLRKLNYLDSNNVITLKGHAACEISSADELVICELLFQREFDNLNDDHLVAFLSCFVFDEKTDVLTPNDAKLLTYFDKIRNTAQRVGKISNDSKLSLNINDYVEKFKPVIMEITLKWMNGTKFASLGLPEDLFEGAVVRALRRLHELLCQLACAAKSIGHNQLESQLSESILKIRRGIVFSSSLYL